MSKINFKNNILYYFLISNLRPKKIIMELINTNNREIYIEAQEILGIFLNRKDLDVERIKIESRKNSFHIFISNFAYRHQQQIHIYYSLSLKCFSVFNSPNSIRTVLY